VTRDAIMVPPRTTTKTKPSGAVATFLLPSLLLLAFLLPSAVAQRQSAPAALRPGVSGNSNSNSNSESDSDSDSDSDSGGDGDWSDYDYGDATTNPLTLSPAAAAACQTTVFSGLAVDCNLNSGGSYDACCNRLGRAVHNVLPWRKPSRPVTRALLLLSLFLSLVITIAGLLLLATLATLASLQRAPCVQAKLYHYTSAPQRTGRASATRASWTLCGQ
jgi:hypothetical protein